MQQSQMHLLLYIQFLGSTSSVLI